MLWLFNQCIEKKLRGAFHNRVNALEKFIITTELIMIPEMRAQPRAACRPEAPQWTINRGGGAPEVGVVMANPTARAILHLGRAASVLDEFRHHPSQRLMTFREISGLRWPVVHLRVDIDCVLAFPWWRH
jgi:hypothetical protein